MTYEEAKKAIDGFKESGRTDEEIVATFYLMFQDDKINVKELGDLVGLVGYELTDEFLNMSPEDQKTKVFEEGNEDEPLFNKDSEEEPKDNEEPAKETVEEEKSETENKDSDDEPKEPTEKIEKDDTQEEKALKLFGLK